MRGIGFLLVLYACAAVACRSSRLVDPLEPLDGRIPVPWTAEALAETPNDSPTLAGPASTVARTSASARGDGSGATLPEVQPGNDDPASADIARRARSADTARPEESRSGSPASTPDAAHPDVASPPRPTEAVGTSDRVAEKPGSWSRIGLAALLVIGGLFVRRLRTRARLRSRPDDSDEAWDVFQTGLEHRPPHE